MKITSVIFYTGLNLFRIALSVFVFLASLSASADTLTWTGTSFGVQTTSTIENWSLVDDTNPNTPNTLWSTSVPYLYPTKGHTMMVKVSSDFLFTDSEHGVHLVLGLNYAPVYTYGPTGYWPNNPVYTEGYWGVGGNLNQFDP